MALINCSECGKEFSDKAEKCPNCGNPNIKIRKTNVNVVIAKEKGVWSTGRLIIGIISLVFFILISFQSCAAGLVNTIDETNSTSGSRGFLLALFMLVAGIVGITTRNAKTKTGSIVCTIFYFLGFLMTNVSEKGDVYEDLPIWGFISLVFAIIFLICAIKTKKNSKQ